MPPATTFHVVIERPRDPGTGAAIRLAEAVADRYGIPAAQLRERLAAGALRVKSNVDLATAESFAADLEQLGAVCAILDSSTGEPIGPKPAPEPRPARSSSSALSPLASLPRSERVSTSPTSLASGLAAAYSTQSSTTEQDLGALGSGEFALATLDGDDDVRPAPSASMLNASFGPPAAQAALSASAPPPAAAPFADPHAPLDLFAPPDASQEEELVLEAAPKRVGQLATLPPPATLAAITEAPPEDPAKPRRAPGLAGWVADARIRLGAGVLLAILIGFIPATVIATVRESGAFADIDRTVKKRFESVYSEDDWNALDPMLARERGRKEDERRNIALGSMVIWALAGAGVGYLWFRRIDWDRVVARLSSR